MINPVFFEIQQAIAKAEKSGRRVESVDISFLLRQKLLMDKTVVQYLEFHPCAGREYTGMKILGVEIFATKTLEGCEWRLNLLEKSND